MTKDILNSTRKAISDNQKKEKNVSYCKHVYNQKTTLPWIPQEPEQQNPQHNYPN